MKVLLLTRYTRRGASSRLRFYQYLPYLNAQGIEVSAAPLLGDAYLDDLYHGRSKRWHTILWAYLLRLRSLLTLFRFDVLWIEYELFPGLPAWIERLISRLNIPYVVDYDDAVFHRYGLHRNRGVRWLLGGKIDLIMRRANVVTAGSAYIAEYAEKARAKRVETVPTAVDLSRYGSGVAERTSGFTVGWIGSPSTARHLSLVAPALAKLSRDAPARLTIVGAQAVGLQGVALQVRPWSEETEVAEIQRFDVGIMPLPDEPWERGKCGFKLIQYMACSRPVVASPVGVNRHIVEHGVNGFLATTQHDWVHALETLRRDPGLRRRLGQAGRTKVERQFSTAVLAPRLTQILRDARAMPARHAE